MLERLSISTKIKIIFVTLLIPIVYIFFLFAQEKMTDIRFAEKEREGNRLIAKITPVLDTVLHLHGSLVEGGQNQSDQINTSQKSLKEQSSELSYLQKNTSIGNIQEKFTATQKSIDVLATQTSSVELTTKTIGDLNGLIEAVGNESGLVLDPDLDSFYIMDTAVVQLRNVFEELSKILAFQGYASNQPSTGGHKNRERVLAIGHLNSSIENIGKNYESASKNNASGSVESALKDSMQQTVKVLKNFIDESEKKSQNLSPEMYQEYENAIKTTLDYWTNTQNELNTLLEARISGIYAAFYASIAVSGFLVLATILIALVIGRQISSSLLNLLEHTQTIQKTGDFSKTLKVSLEDEVGQLTKAFNEFVHYVDVSKKNEAKLFEERQREALDQREKEQAITEDIQNLIQKAAKGNLDERISLVRLQGLQEGMANSVNTLLQTTQTALQEVASITQSLSQGDLTKRITTNYEGIFQELQQSINSMSFHLSKTVGKIHETVQETAFACNEISAGIVDLEKRTSAQEENVNRISKTLASISDSVLQTNQQTQAIANYADQASETLENGITTVKKSSNSMDKIKESSKSIENIMQVIDDIAFQTNLLALNAAVEAARAGDAGKGFAVVAQEVRSLAGQCADSSQQIRQLINTNNKQVLDGVKSVSEVSTLLSSITDVMREITETITQVTENSHNQSSHVNDINRLMHDFESDIQNNSALVTQCVSTLNSLEMQTQTLSEMTSYFKIEEQRVQTHH